MQGTLATDRNHVNASQQSPVWLYGVVVMDAFVLGGVLAMILVNDLLTTIMYRLVSGEAQGEILNVLDHILPYQIGFWGAALVLTVLTSIALQFQTRSWRIAALPLVGFAALCALQYFVR